MNKNKEDLIEAAGRLILQSEINSLSIEELEMRLGLTHEELSMHFSRDNDILLTLVISLETSILQLIDNMANISLTPDEALQTLFKDLYRLFEQKPIFLSVIFDKHLEERNSEILVTIKRTKKSVESFLLQIINKGKNENIFQAELKSRYLVNRILVSFRQHMNEKWVTESFLKNIEHLKSSSSED
ncbi:MAG: hypothetical protein FD170_1531 [Bacteroidetes bacterium]|nr:MAG: hypothetical protein FD170_1531 [Bacteroidota bacterium]